MNEIRIREPGNSLPEGYSVSKFIWPARKGPPPLKPRSQAAIEANERLEKDVRRWTLRAIAAGL